MATFGFSFSRRTALSCSPMAAKPWARLVQEMQLRAVAFGGTAAIRAR